jgi:hypothetical protein
MLLSYYRQRLFSIALFTLLLLGHTLAVTGQEDVYIKLYKFSILVETFGDEISLTCHDGCAWKQLSFTTSTFDKAQGIDQNGMTSFPNHQISADTKPSTFIITIARTLEGVTVEGKAGTAWTSLTFSCPDN